MLTRMTSDQRRHLEEIGRTWHHHAALLRGQDDLAGGMQWKLAAGNEYLTRYWSDPLSGKKVARSLGRRSAETESLYQDFLARREKARAEAAALAPRIEMAGRFAKALRLTRMPSKHAAGLRNLWRAGRLQEDGSGVIALGATALMLYEIKSGWLAPPTALKDDDGASFLFPETEEVGWEQAMEFAIAFGGRDAAVETIDADGGRRRLSVGGAQITLYGHRAIDESTERLEAPPIVKECVTDALRAPPVTGFVFARDATMAPVSAPDPRALCLLSPLLASDDENTLKDAWTRCEAVEEMVRERWKQAPFTAAMNDALEELRECANPEAVGGFPTL